MNEHRGRQKGVPNRVTAATREQIASMADPISFLTDVMNDKVTVSVKLYIAAMDSVLSLIAERRRGRGWR